MELQIGLLHFPSSSGATTVVPWKIPSPNGTRKGRVRNPKNELSQINSPTTVGCSLEYPIAKIPMKLEARLNKIILIYEASFVTPVQELMSCVSSIASEASFSECLNCYLQLVIVTVHIVYKELPNVDQ